MLFPFQGLTTEQEVLNEKIIKGAANVLSDIRVLENEINDFKNSDFCRWSIIGEDYYTGEQDILEAKRTMIDENGGLRAVSYLPNNRSVDNQYARLVDQKVNYQLGKQLTFNTDNEAYADALKEMFDKSFTKKLRTVGYNVLNGGLGWIMPYLDAGELKFKVFKAHEIIPFWKDEGRTELESAVRLYKEYSYEGGNKVETEKVDVYAVDGVVTYKYYNGRLIDDVESIPQAYITAYTQGEEGLIENYLNWSTIPLIPVRFNMYDEGLIKRVKSLQDALNTMSNDLMNRMQEDGHNTILILENYDGQSLGEFRKNLATYGAIKVRSGDGGGGKGDVRTLTVNVNTENFQYIKKELKASIIENGRGYDISKISGSPTQIEIKSIYSDIEMDANGFEIELQESFEKILWFVDIYLKNVKGQDFINEKVEVVFNRDTMVNEREVVDILNISPYLSDKTKIAMHPYIDDVEEEEKRLKEQQESDPLNNNYNELFNGGSNDEGINQ